MAHRCIHLMVVAWLAFCFGWVAPTHDCRHWRMADQAAAPEACGHNHQCCARSTAPADDGEPRPQEHDHGPCAIHFLLTRADAPPIDIDTSLDDPRPQRLGREADGRILALLADPRHRGRAPPTG